MVQINRTMQVQGFGTRTSLRTEILEQGVKRELLLDADVTVPHDGGEFRGPRGHGRLPVSPVPAAPGTWPARRRAGGAAWPRYRPRRRSSGRAAFPPVPPPRRDEHRVDTVLSRKLADGEPADLRVAPPLPLTGHHHVRVERGQEPQAPRAGVVIDSGEALVQRDQPRRIKVTRRL